MNYPNKPIQACPCGSGRSHSSCCGPLIEGKSTASSPQALMRSRYTAYAIKAFDYVLDTYATQSRPSISASDLANDNQNTTWLRLVVHEYEQGLSTGKVSFSAFYKDKQNIYCLAEGSRFVLENDEWRYLDGELLPATGKLKVGRNDPCPCGSTQKAKKCCLR
ncbi:YchJ family protein [Alteromonas flava]|uniref:YchJ family protein n=1 Tax=Alteromonas flava TaxID=2048003 RepID=UPI0023E83E0B|nr:YchJ family protein [Alteromonas flava]